MKFLKMWLQKPFKFEKKKLKKHYIYNFLLSWSILVFCLLLGTLIKSNLLFMYLNAPAMLPGSPLQPGRWYFKRSNVPVECLYQTQK